MKPFLAILFAAFLLQGCRGHATDSDDPGTSAGNDTITVMDRHGTHEYDDYVETPGSGNVSPSADSANDGVQGYDSLQGGRRSGVGSGNYIGTGSGVDTSTKSTQKPR